jgi:hypothetical protein
MKVKLNPMVDRLSGKVEGITFRWMYGKQTVMKTPDMSKVKWSKAQKANRERFSEAIAYARAAMADTKVHAHYEKVGKKAGRQPFRVAVSDFLAGKNLFKDE